MSAGFQCVFIACTCKSVHEKCVFNLNIFKVSVRLMHLHITLYCICCISLYVISHPTVQELLYIKSSELCKLDSVPKDKHLSECRNCHVYISTGQLWKISQRYTTDNREISVCFLTSVKEDVLLESEGTMLKVGKKKSSRRPFSGMFSALLEQLGKNVHVHCDFA